MLPTKTYEHMLLTPEEQLATEERTLVDAALIQGGARISKFGTLILTADQLQIAEHFRNIFEPMPVQDDVNLYPQYTPGPNTLTDPKIELLLEAKVEEAGLSTRAKNCLLREGIHSLRDILTTGTRYIDEIHNLGSKSRAEIQQYVERQGFSAFFQDEPSVHDIAQLTHGLHQVPRAVLSRHGFRMPWDICFMIMDFPTVQSVLEGANDPSVRGQYDGHRVAKILQEARPAAEEFARLYIEAKGTD